MPEVELAGCRPEPIGSYLKALGVLRLVAEQADPDALGWWEDETFVLASSLSADELISFFLERYAPTPLIAPWNKDSGFYRPDSSVGQLARSGDPRLEGYRESVEAARAALAGRAEPPSGDDKARFVAELRSRLPEPFVRWIDAIGTLAADDPTWAPLFGAGGADGRMEFTRVFAECLLEVLEPGGGRGRGAGRTRSAGALHAALFEDQAPGSTIKATGGLLHPSSVDAPNAATGFVGEKRLNPWDYVLLVEGAVLLAGAVSRRFGVALPARAAFPFTVEAAGGGHAAPGDEPSRGELWLPLWHRPMALVELVHLFREARAEWRGRPAATAADMARAIVSLGVDRGLSAFVRFGVQGRAGRSFLAVGLGRWPVTVRPEIELLGELDEFLGALRRIRRDARRDVPRSVTDAVRRLDTSILQYAALGGRDRLLEVLLSVTEAELALAGRPGLRPRGFPRPLRGLSGRWVTACDDGSVEFELAAAVASLRPAGDPDGPGEFRAHVEPVVRAGPAWTWAEGIQHAVVWTGRDVVRDLGTVLERRLVDAQREGTDPGLDGRLRASPLSVAAFLEGEVDPVRLARLIEALALIDWEAVRWDREPVLLRKRRGSAGAIPDAYALLKLALLGRPIRVGDQEIEVRPDRSTVGLLWAGQVWEATLRAARRLRAAGVSPRARRSGRASPVGSDPRLGRLLVAALLVPVQELPLTARVVGEATERQSVTEEEGS